MAGTLQITDGTTTINLLNTSAGLYIEDGGWKPAVAKEDENGDYEDMIEVITCTWTQTNDDDRAETLKSIKRLDRKAREHWRKRLVDGWVWLVASTHSETDARYAIIKSIDIKELDPRHWAANGPVKVTLVIKHILWWGIAPNGTPLSVINSQTVYNKSDADGDNWVTIDAADIPGDAPAITIIDLSGGTSLLGEFTLSLKTGSTTALNNFNPHFNVNDELDQTHATDTNAPADREINRTGVTSWTARWELSARLDYYRGFYQAYLVGKSSVANDATVRLYQGDIIPFGPAPETNDIDLVVSTIWNYKNHYLGAINIPARRNTPPSSDITLPTDYPLRLIFEQSSGTTVTIANFYLVPVDEGVMTVRATTGTAVVIDGSKNLVYSRSGTEYLGTITPVHEGKFLELVPGRENRIYLFNSFHDASLSYPTYPNPITPNQSIVVNVDIIPRYTSLRGDD